MAKGMRWSEDQLAAHLKGKQITPAAAKASSPKPAKFLNQKTEAGGFIHDGKTEATRWMLLKDLERCGIITDLTRQVPFAIVVNDILICQYTADAVYKRDGVRIVEDTKSPRTRKLPAYRLKMRLMKAVLGIEVQEYLK